MQFRGGFMRVLMIAPTPFFSHRGTHIRILEEARSLEKRARNDSVTRKLLAIAPVFVVLLLGINVNEKKRKRISCKKKKKSAC